MYWKLLKNDLKNHLLQTCSIGFFIMISVAFLATAGQLGGQLTDSINHLFKEAKTPHLLQMHTGEIDVERMENFVESHSEITDYQILPFLNIDNNLLAFNGQSLKDSVYDNGFSVQSPRFDYLLDTKGNLIDAKAGQVYVPIFYQTVGLAKEGDILTIGEHTLKVVGFVRDSQMNSSISSSRRFIIHQQDYDKMVTKGDLEYLIEFRLEDPSQASQIETAYHDANLEADGPPMISYTLFMVVNAFSDGITIMTMIFISLLIISISLLCIRLTLLAKLEEDYRELAVLKATGLPLKEIKNIFLAKYMFITVIATFLGFVLSFLLKQPLLVNMKMFFGEAKDTVWTYLIAALLSISIFLIIYWRMSSLAKGLKDLQLNPALINQATKPSKQLRLLPQTFYLAMSDLLARKKVYMTMMLVLILSIFVLTIPMSIYSTISNRQFVNYLGIGSYDVRVDMSQLAGKDKEIQTLVKDLQANSDVKKMEIYRSKMVGYLPEKGSPQKLWLDFGNQTTFPIRYVTGRSPKGEGEISLSQLKAEDIKKKVGDTIKLSVDGQPKTVTISGIYSDLTNGGKTAKANFQTSDKNLIWMILPLDLKNNLDSQKFVATYQEKYTFAKFSDTQTYVQQIFGNTIHMIRMMTWLAFGVAITLVFIITLLFIRMIYLKDQSENALMKALGFTNTYLYHQYFLKAGLVLFISLILGNVLAMTLGDSLAAGVLSAIGVSGVQFIREPMFIYLLVPVTMLISTMSATYLGLKGLKSMNVAQILKEE